MLCNSQKVVVRFQLPVGVTQRQPKIALGRDGLEISQSLALGIRTTSPPTMGPHGCSN